MQSLEEEIIQSTSRPQKYRRNSAPPAKDKHDKGLKNALATLNQRAAKLKKNEKITPEEITKEIEKLDKDFNPKIEEYEEKTSILNQRI